MKNIFIILLHTLMSFSAAYATDIGLNVGDSVTIGSDKIFCGEDNGKCSYISGKIYCGYNCENISGKVYCSTFSNGKCTYFYGKVYCGVGCEYISGNVYCYSGGLALPATPAKPK